MEEYWKHKTLAEMTKEEWEGLCDGCGWCCVHKIQDIDTNEVFYTNVICKFIDMHRCSCTDYEHRTQNVPTCVRLTPELIPQLTWLPETCAYRRVSEGKDLPEWHYLRSGSDFKVHQLGFSARDKVVNEKDVDMERLEDYVVE
jgi:uncharacterized cysteine cluster protein YcgN (CxxCxxCC family)